tara:strand:+ start:5426 stop:6094 length:669 start_codon:yes stop_codon:yes gene_type:complete
MQHLPAVNPTALAKGLTQAKERISIDSGDIPYLKLAKHGEWTYGSDDVEVQEGAKWAVNPNSFSEGYVAWGSGEILGEEMRSMVAGVPVLLNELPDVGKPWKKQVSYLLRCMNGDDEGQQVLYKVSSKGGLKAAQKLINEVIVQIDKDPLNIVPVIELKMTSYKHKQYGTIFNPITDPLDFVDFDGYGSDEPVAIAPEAAPTPPEQEAAPAKDKRKRRAIAS